MAHVDYSAIPETVQVDLCYMAILGTMEAMKTPEGRAAIEKGKQIYLRNRARLEGREFKNGDVQK